MFQGPDKPGAQRIKIFECPSYPIASWIYRPDTSYRGVPAGQAYAAIWSYAHNMGTLDLGQPITDVEDLAVVVSEGWPNDGAFATDPPEEGLSVDEFTDGASNTFIVGERDSRDDCVDDFKTGKQSHWAVPIAGTTEAPLNYRTSPECNDHKDDQLYPEYWLPRLYAFGSGHAGGANFCYTDGSVRFLGNDIPHITYQALSTRASGEVVDEPD